MTVAVYEQALHQRLKMPKTAPARKECACYLGGDIGAYNIREVFSPHFANSPGLTAAREMIIRGKNTGAGIRGLSPLMPALLL